MGHHQSVNLRTAVDYPFSKRKKTIIENAIPLVLQFKEISI